jgi:UDP-arabinose 4-epimerase
MATRAMTGETVLVTGGAGYIGAHTCKALAAENFRPVAYDDLSRGHRWAVRWGPFEEGDVADGDRLRRVFEKYRPAAVIHFAAFAYVGESVADPGRYYRNNVAGTLSLLEAMRDVGIPQLVFSSTCATYGIPVRIPIVEETPQVPINPYGATKLIAERMLMDFGEAHGLTSIALRYFNAAGADPEGELGEEHDPEPHLIPLVLKAASSGEIVTIFGNDYDTPDGTCIRDYIHVSDLADAHVRALAANVALGRCTALNLGTGEGYSVADVIKIAEKVTGRRIRVVVGPRRLGDPALLVANAAKARTVLDWCPRFSQLENMIETAWRWHQRHSPPD